MDFIYFTWLFLHGSFFSKMKYNYVLLVSAIYVVVSAVPFDQVPGAAMPIDAFPEITPADDQDIPPSSLQPNEDDGARYLTARERMKLFGDFCVGSCKYMKRRVMNSLRKNSASAEDFGVANFAPADEIHNPASSDDQDAPIMPQRRRRRTALEVIEEEFARQQAEEMMQNRESSGQSIAEDTGEVLQEGQRTESSPDFVGDTTSSDETAGSANELPRPGLPSRLWTCTKGVCKYLGRQMRKNPFKKSPVIEFPASGAFEPQFEQPEPVVADIAPGQSRKTAPQLIDEHFAALRAEEAAAAASAQSHNSVDDSIPDVETGALFGDPVGDGMIEPEEPAEPINDLPVSFPEETQSEEPSESSEIQPDAAMLEGNDDISVKSDQIMDPSEISRRERLRHAWRNYKNRFLGRQQQEIYP